MLREKTGVDGFAALYRVLLCGKQIFNQTSMCV